MNPQLHAFFVHFPVALSFVMPVIVAWAIIQFKKDEASANRVWAMVAIPMVIMAVFTILAVMAGENAHELLEHYMDNKPIKEHEEIAEVLAMIIYINAGLSLFIFMFRAKRRFYFMIAILLISLVSLGMAIAAGKTGGEVVHKYESPTYMNKAIADGGLQKLGNGHHHDDDDDD